MRWTSSASDAVRALGSRATSPRAAEVTAVASELGIGRNTLYRWLRKYSIDLDDYREPES